MVGTACWIGIGVLTLGWELFSRRRGERFADLARIAAGIWRRPVGRVGLLVLWAFVGWHFFARATIPR
jgi:hypothetical protein